MKHQPEAGVSRNGGRKAAERVYRDSLHKGRPLSTRDVARIARCSPTTAWRAIQATKQPTPPTSPNGAPPSEDRPAAEAATLVEV